jgi:hypothetical protein
MEIVKPVLIFQNGLFSFVPGTPNRAHISLLFLINYAKAALFLSNPFFLASTVYLV